MTRRSDLFLGATVRHLDLGEAGQVAHREVGHGPDVLFVHGWPVSGATFRHLLPHLADHVTCHVIDLPGAGDSRFGPGSDISFTRHIESVRQIVAMLELTDVAIVGHDSGGMIARHALADDSRVRAWGLIDTEQPPKLTWRVKQFLVARHLPGFERLFGWSMGNRLVRRAPWMLGGAFVDRSLIDGEFDELFLQPIRRDPDRRRAAVELLATFDEQHVRDLAGLHDRMGAPVMLVWGEHDRFFPVDRARAMVDTFAAAELEVIAGCRLFPHEERPAEVARALLHVLRADP